MPHRALNNFLGLAVLATLLAVAGYQYIPDKTFYIIPSNQWRLDLLTVYSDQQRDIAEWVNGNHTHFKCTLDAPSKIQPYCTFNAYFAESFLVGVNLTGYDTLHIDSTYTGNIERARIFMRNYNPEYSTPADANSAKFLSLTVSTHEFAQGGPVEIGFNEFMVAEWWQTQRDLNRDQLPPEFGNITLLGFDFTPYLPETVDVNFNIRRMYFSGPRIKEQHWYLGVLVAWVLGVMLFLLAQILAAAARNRQFSQQVTQLEKQSEKYKELSNIDPLTGALNRLGLESFIKGVYEKTPKASYAVLLMDIDHFKRINDRRGHDAGDNILKDLTKLILKLVREGDMLSRWGGEEFVVMIKTDTIQNAFSAAEKLRAAIANYNFEPQKPLTVTSSFGVTLFKPGERLEIALKRADIALYQAKDHGRNCCITAKEDALKQRLP